ncbi:MAG TPA: ice-binding family protein [Gemmatimonadales bacterium]|nr:ice-binding family protein [Gemmatimonadales bacterium]
MLNVSRSTARLLVIVPFAALLAAACEHNDGPTIPVAGQLLTITVTPNPGSAQIGNTIQYAAAGQDVNGAAVTIPPPLVWANLNATAGTINGSSGLFTAGNTAGTYNNTVRAQSGNIAGFAGAIVTSAPAPILGTASTYGILAGSTVTCVTGGTINADVGVSPGSTTTGFPPCTITGATNLANAASAQAQVDLTAAFNQLAGLPCGTVITPADLGGRTLPPGVYCVASSLGVTGTVTLAGPASGVWVFQIGSTLTTGTTANIALSGGALARNVWWQVGSSATLGTGTTFRGNIVALTSITLVDNATMLGRALARNGAVSLGTNNTITLP